MADHLIAPTNRRLYLGVAAASLGAMCLLFSASVPAEDLQDPTRPPASVVEPEAEKLIMVEPPKPAGLQSVIISKGRSAAIIDGQIIELGGKYGDVRLIEVSDIGVILQGARGRQVMKLFPDVSMSKKTVKSGS